MPTPIITTGLDKRFVEDDATPWTVFATELATVPIVLPATFATEPIVPPIEFVTLPTSCPGIEIIFFNSPPVVLMI